ncbi:hypothetical protein ACFP65_03375 [Marinilactibacillus sp. GCM10026970]|uniref:hypothetical protein n=1 Tax=Marinilactibacillus sp. GCM10026970 TaxID=3252642 RepID=UPI003613D2B6
MGTEFRGIIDPGEPVAEKDSKALVTKYLDRLNIVEVKEVPIEVVRKLVDLEEYPLENIVKAHLEILEYNIKCSPAYSGEAIEIQLYKVVKNEKSQLYYDEIRVSGEGMFQPYFDDLTMVIAVEKTVGVIESGSQLFSYDFSFLRGMTTKELVEASPELTNFLAMIEIFETPFKDRKEIDRLFNEIRKVE